jgi:DNA replication protein DnaC
LFLGQPGCGKTHLAVALATKAVEAGYRGYFTTADEMVAALMAARRDGSFAAKLRTYTAPSVLVVDDVGLLPMEPGGATAFFHVANTRCEKGHPTLVTTNRGLPGWGEVFGDAVVAGAILDRLMHRAVVFNIRGPSWRMREHAALAEAARA